ncbi:MAG: hypothetical protein LQ344_003795 [Seirophora lacunosa]|nr:MAG: hypothetical protein LQ344_003795 [Seirophora lacunosa]
MDPVQSNQALISQDGDTLVIQLPNAILRVLLPTVLIAGRVTTAEVFSERYERRVDLVAQRGRFEVRDVDHNLLVDYQEMSSWTEDTLQPGFDILEDSTNVSAANSVFEEPLAHGYRDARSRSRSSNLRGRSPDEANHARKSTPDTDHDLFLHDSPPTGANKRKVDRDTSPPTVISPEKHKRIAVVPKENSIPQIMRASERVRAHEVGHHKISARARTWSMSKSKRQTSESTADRRRRRTTPPRDPAAAKLAQSTPPSHRFQTPSSGTPQCNSSPATLKGSKFIHTPAVSASSPSTNYYSSPPAAPHMPWREIGKQPLVVKYKGTMDSRSREEKRVSSSSSSSSSAGKTWVDIRSMPPEREVSPSARKAKGAWVPVLEGAALEMKGRGGMDRRKGKGGLFVDENP